MLDRARGFLLDAGVAESDIVRVDVPGRGAGEEGAGTLRSELEPVVPLVQSGSLFGGRLGLELVGANHLMAAEAEILARLISDLDPDGAAIAIISEGSVPAALAKMVKAKGQSVTVGKIWEREVGPWVSDEAAGRGLNLEPAAVAALVQRFGSDLSSLESALDQLAGVKGKITGASILERFKNRPSEPIFHYVDAVAKGDTAEALRRLGDLIIHQHPLVLLASLETELRRRAMAASAPDKEAFARQVGARPGDRWVDRVWGQRHRLRDSSLRRALQAMVRADRMLKSAPEELHRVTIERLTVAMCRYMTGR